jgi:hypothetical protein
MKKYFIAIALFFCVNFAQAYVRLVRGTNECGIVKVVYTNEGSLDLGTLCQGDDSFDTGTNVVAYIVVNDIQCDPEDETPVLLNGVPVTVRYDSAEDAWIIE